MISVFLPTYICDVCHYCFEAESLSGQPRKRRFKTCSEQGLKIKKKRAVCSSSNVGDEHMARFI